MKSILPTLAAAVFFLLLPGLLLRPLLPIDETRYLSVAWEMYRDGDWLVPHLNGEPYSHKPPLLFWLIAALWQIVGPQEWIARLVAPAFGLAALALTAAAARRLWPGEAGRKSAVFAPFILLATVLWAIFSTVTMFDTMLAVFVLLALHGALDLAEGARRRGFFLLILAIGLGLLAKGPVILVYVLAGLVAAGLTGLRKPDRPWRWLGQVALGLLSGLLVALTWALPAAYHGGQGYADAIFLEQSAGRIVESFAHRRPFWWYFALLPLLLLPWSLMPALWRALPKALATGDPSLRFCFIWFALGLLAFSLVSGKQVHYLLPLLPPLSLALARLTERAEFRSIDRLAAILPLLLPAAALLALMVPGLAEADWLSDRDLPDWLRAAAPPLALALFVLSAIVLFLPKGVLPPAAASLGLYLTIHLAAMPHARPYYDMGPIAERIADLQGQGRPIAYVGRYHGQFDFVGRLAEPLQRIDWNALRDWGAANGEGVIVLVPPATGEGAPPALFLQPYRGRSIGIWSAEQADALARLGR